MRYQLSALPVFDDDGMIQMSKQELAAYEDARKCASARSKTALSSGGYIREGLPRQKKAAKIMMAISSCSAAAEHVFSLMPAAFSAHHERVLQDYSWRRHWCSSSTESQQPCAAVKSQSAAAVLAVHHLYPVSNSGGNHFKGVCLDAVEYDGSETRHISITIGN